MKRLAVRASRWAVMGFICAVSLALMYGVYQSRTAKRDWGALRFLVWVVPASFPFAYASRSWDNARRMHKALEALARDTGGRASWTGLLDPDLDLTWVRGGVRAHLHAWLEDITDSSKGGDPPASAVYRFRYTLELPPKSMRLRLDVRPETVLEAVAKMFGMQDLSLGHPELDRQLIVQASDQDEYKRCVGLGLGSALGDLLRLSTETSVAHVSFCSGRLVVQRSIHLRRRDGGEERAVRQLHLVTLHLAAAITGLDVEAVLRGGPVAEVTVLTPVPEGAACLVCGGAIEHALVICVRCETPHHHDCWEYNGACALYACGSREARRARRAAAVT